MLVLRAKDKVGKSESIMIDGLLTCSLASTPSLGMKLLSSPSAFHSLCSCQYLKAKLS